MKALSKKQRREIYLEAAENIAYGSSIRQDLFVCNQLELISRRETDEFLEFQLFRPSYFEKKREGTDGREGWWAYENINVRIIALLLCYHMSK